MVLNTLYEISHLFINCLVAFERQFHRIVKGRATDTLLELESQNYL